MTTTQKVITPQQAYEWVKTGHWSLKEFQVWFTSAAENIVSAGYESGYEDGGQAAHESF